MFTFLLPLLALSTSLISALDSPDYAIQSINNRGFLYATKLTPELYKIGLFGGSGAATHFSIHDVQNVNNATIHAPEIGPTAILDVYKVREGGAPSAQVFVRTNMTKEEIGWDQEISIADAHLNYYEWNYDYVFYC